MSKKTIVNHLPRVRKSLGLSQAALAKLSGASQAQICCIETLRHRASPLMAERIAKAINKKAKVIAITEMQILYPTRVWHDV